jgi:two-component system, NarL family, invasion response regulator UvrY
MKIKVMLVDDHAVVRSGFRVLLETWDNVEVTAEAASAEECLELVETHHPDVIVMDISMQGMGGLEGIKRLKSKDPRVRILTLSAHEDTSYARRALQYGALGYLSKRTAPEVLIDAIEAIAKYQHYIDPVIAQQLVTQDLSVKESPIEKLSPREFEVFIQLANGHSVNQISTHLNLSSSTVGTHLYKIKQKLNLNNQSEMTLLAVNLGLI